MAKEAVDEALRLDPDLREAHEALGWYHYSASLEDYESAMPKSVTMVLPPVSAASPLESNVFVATVVDDPPEHVQCPSLHYPATMQQAGIEGAVLLQFVVETDGHVKPETVETIQSTHEPFEAPAEAMIAQCLFRPGRVRGVPVRVLVQMPLEFTLQGN